jgi:hypothetical protein
MFRAWRCYDQIPLRFNKFVPCAAKIQVAPAALIRAFGPPQDPEDVNGSSGEFIFEDWHLNLYKMYDSYETREFWRGRYDKSKHLPRSLKGKSAETLPTREEFW